MVKPNDNPRVADGDYGEGDNDLNNEPGDLAIIQLPLPAPGLLAHQVPMYICYNPHVHGVRQIDNDRGYNVQSLSKIMSSRSHYVR